MNTTNDTHPLASTSPAQSVQAADRQENILIREESNGVVTLTMNRPLQFNALSEALLTALQQHLDTIAHEPDVRCVILAGAGKAFCAGHDLREMRERPSLAAYKDLFTQCSRVMLSIQTLPVPVIARVHGIATAAGCQLVGSCDLAVASTSARFAVSGINVGLFCATPSVALTRNVSMKRAFEMLVTGKFIDAATAADWGLINAAVAPENLDDTIAQLVGQILAKSPAAIRYGKAMVYRQKQMPLPDAYAYASEVMATNMMEEDAAEGIDAFLQKRSPTWRASVTKG